MQLQNSPDEADGNGGGTATVTTPAPAAASTTVNASAATAAAPATQAAPAAPAVPWTKPADPAPAKQEEIKVTVPKDSFMKPADVERFTSFAKESGLTSDQAQKLLDRDHADRKAWLDSQAVSLAEQSSAWLNDLKKDRDLGGAKWGETEQNVTRALDKFDPTGAFRKGAAEAGVAYWPELVKLLNGIGASMREGRLDAPANTPPPKDNRSPMEKMAEDYNRRLQQQR